MEQFFLRQNDCVARYRNEVRNHFALYKMLHRKEYRERALAKDSMYYAMLNLQSAQYLLTWVQDFPYDLDLFVTDVREV